MNGGSSAPSLSANRPAFMFFEISEMALLERTTLRLTSSRFTLG